MKVCAAIYGEERTILRKFHHRTGEIVLVALLILLFVPVSEAVNSNIGLPMTGYESDIVVSAPATALTLEFPLPRLAKLQSATATVFLTPSAQLHAETIFFFYFDDKLVEVRTVKELRQRNSLTFNLPIDRNTQGALRLQIKSKMFISDDLCRDLYSGGLFFTVHKETKLSVNYDMLPVRTVGDFFGSFQQSLFVVVPANAALPEMMPAAWTYGLLKKNFPHLDIQIVRAGELAGKPMAPRIWVGLRRQLPAYFDKTQPGMVLADPNTLLISAEDATSLATLTKQLADLPVFPVNPAASQRITVAPVETPVGKATEAIAFGNFSVQEGIQTVPADFLLYPAQLSKLPERLGFHLEGAYTVGADSLRPVRLDVLFNNNLVHSSMLDQSGQFRREIVLPAGVELLSRNNLNVQFAYPEEPAQCPVRGKTQSAQIYPTSYMWGAGQIKPPSLAWNSLGLYLTKNGTLLVDETLGGSLLKVIADTVVLLNRQLPSATYAFPAALPLAEQTTIPANQYIVVVAMNKNIPEFLQEKMPIALGQDFTLLRKDNLTSRFDYQANVNSVVGRIGDHKGFPLLILSANQEATLLAEALQHLNKSDHYARLNGNIMVYRQTGPVYSLDIRDKSVKIEQPAAKGMAAQLWEQNNRLVVATAALLIILLLCLIFFRHLKSKPKPPAQE
jgi:hypothetical protein